MQVLDQTRPDKKGSSTTMMGRARPSWPVLVQLFLALRVRWISGGSAGERRQDPATVTGLVAPSHPHRHATERQSGKQQDERLLRVLAAEGFDFELIQLARSGFDIEINRYIDGSGVKRCRQNLEAADTDGNGQLSQGEYADFVTLESEGALNETFAGLGASFISLYYVVACDQCYGATRNDTCCVGDGAFIGLPESADDASFDRTLIFLCSSVEEAIAEATGPTAAPATSSPTSLPVPSPQPTPSPRSPAPNAATEGPTATPSGQSTTAEPSSAPTQTPATSASPSLPTEKPTEISPTTSPTTLTPSDRPSELPTRSNTSPPTSAPTEYSPVRIPSASPLLNLTGAPTTTSNRTTTASPSAETPTRAPDSSPVSPSPLTAAPTLTPSSSTPVQQPPTAAPIPPEDLLCIQFFFSIQNRAGLTASDILLGVNNTLRQGLELAARNVTIEILNGTFPRSSSSSSSRRKTSSNIFGQPPRQPDSTDTAAPPRPSTPAQVETRPVVRSGHYEVGTLERMVCQALAREFGNATSVAMLDSFVSTLYNVKVVDWPRGRERSHPRRELQPVVHAAEASSLLPARRERELQRQQRGRRRRRRLVYYSDLVPPNVTSVVDDPFCPLDDNATDVKCAIVSMQVCVVLEPGDNSTAIEGALSEGFRTAIRTGAFFDAIPPENLP